MSALQSVRYGPRKASRLVPVHDVGEKEHESRCTTEQMLGVSEIQSMTWNADGCCRCEVGYGEDWT